MARTTTIKAIAEQVEERSSKKVDNDARSNFNPDEYLSSGSTLLNLALTDDPFCGWQKGKMANVIGDSSSGKTFLTLTAFAEASADERFDDFRLIMDDAEHANEFNLQYLFGDAVASRIEPPKVNYNSGDDVNSEVIEDFHANVRNALKKGEPFVYVLDSMDALDSEADQKKIEEQMVAREKNLEAIEEGKKGKDIKGSYGMAKAKKNSEILRDVVGKLERSESILLIISQTRDNIDPLSFTKKTRSGGKALKFYATHELWTANGGSIKKRDRVVGVYCKVKVSKNKITGKVREVEFPIYYDYGIDDIASCVDFLLKEKEWTGGGKSAIDTKGDLGIKKPMTRDALIKHIEDKRLEDDLRNIVGDVWLAIEDSLKLGRKKKYV